MINEGRCPCTPSAQPAALAMETTATAVLARTAECAALLAIGYQLRAARLFSATDAEVRPDSSPNGAHSQLEQHSSHGIWTKKGYNCRCGGVMQAAQRLAGYLTLPAVVLQSCNT